MIAVKLEGRLGNQLFQYAFIYATARRLNTSFYLDKSIEKFMLPKYFEVKNDFLKPLDKSLFSIKGFKNFFRIHAKKTFYHHFGNIIFKQHKLTINNRTPVDEVLNLIENNYLYKGFFQSESYFKDVEAEIRALFQIKKPYATAFEELNRQLDASKKKVVIHIRRGDYVDLEISLPITYYKTAIENIDDAGVKYIFISDDPDFIEKEFGYLADKYISNHNEIIDLQLLINADICILSGSSFSWWGAWLNTNKNKQIFAPKYWLGFKEGSEYPMGISNNINVNWIQV